MHWVPLFDENTSRKVGAFLPEVDRVPGKKKKKKKERRATSCKYCMDRLLGWFTQLRRGPYKCRTFLFFLFGRFRQPFAACTGSCIRAFTLLLDHLNFAWSEVLSSSDITPGNATPWFARAFVFHKEIAFILFTMLREGTKFSSGTAVELWLPLETKF